MLSLDHHAGNSVRIAVGSQRQAYFARKMVEPGVTIRTWRPGDRMHPLGGPGTRKLQDIFVDKHVPREVRDRIPILEVDGKIIWVAGVAMTSRPESSPKRIICST